MEGKKGRPDRSSAVYCQSGVSINFHGNCIILGSLRAGSTLASESESGTFSPVRTPFRTAAVALIAFVIAACSFLYRFNTLGGPLGGFDNDHFPQLVRSITMLDGERPLRDFTDAELRALWPAPTYSTSALAQRVFGRSLRSEAMLTVGMLSIGAAALFLVSARFRSGDSASVGCHDACCRIETRALQLSEDCPLRTRRWCDARLRAASRPTFVCDAWSRCRYRRALPP